MGSEGIHPDTDTGTTAEAEASATYNSEFFPPRAFKHPVVGMGGIGGTGRHAPDEDIELALQVVSGAGLGTEGPVFVSIGVPAVPVAVEIGITTGSEAYSVTYTSVPLGVMAAS